jgi:hypothetical protein
MRRALGAIGRWLETEAAHTTIIFIFVPPIVALTATGFF